MNPYTPAESLDDIYKRISPEPLIKPSEFDAFYRSEVNNLRGQDKVRLIALGLGRAFGSLHYKAFLMGHSGVGKSTELTRLIGLSEVSKHYMPIRFSASKELDPINFQPFDVLLLMMGEVARRTAMKVSEGGAGTQPPKARLQELWDWFAAEKVTHTKATELAARLEAGGGVKGDSIWAKALGLFASLRGEMKFASARVKETVEYRLSRLSELIGLANRLLDDCNQLLRKRVNKEWLFVGEDFDKAGIPSQSTERLFVTYSNVFKELRSHFVFVIPITLGYSQKAVQFSIPSDRVHCLTDTPVYSRNHSPHEQGRSALREVLKARLSLDLFAEGQLERVIVASGGNIRDMFSLVSTASDLAILRKVSKMEAPDVDAAINDLRTEYERRLGESPYDPEPVLYAQKAERLDAIYNGKREAEVPDPVLYSLLRARAVQEFNGERWFGVHPLVVDVLESQDKLTPTAGGAVSGGTRE